MRLAYATTASFLAVMFTAGHALAADPESCRSVRMAEPGWNDLALTTGIASVLLNALGYEAKSDILGVNVIFEGMKNKDLDAFLGYWDPAMTSYFAPYKDGSIETIGVNLTGAKYTFAVPTYAWNAGVKDINDLHKFADQFDHKMYGIEPGSNQAMFDAVADPSLDLKGWQVVESSEAGMLSEVGYKIKEKKFVLFQGWAPHPMNTMYDFKYLTGGDKFYGADFGAATVSTQTRKGYVEECPNVGRLLKNLVFNIDLENTGMGYLINDGMEPLDGALKSIKQNPDKLNAWLAGVTTFDGKPGLEAVKAKLGL